VNPRTIRILAIVATGISIAGGVGVILYLAGLLATGNP
jgi:hypothetical protein